MLESELQHIGEGILCVFFSCKMCFKNGFDEKKKKMKLCCDAVLNTVSALPSPITLDRSHTVYILHRLLL